MALTFGSLFSGIGGLDLGVERAGWELRWQAETDPHCSEVLARHWPGVPNLGDVTAIDWHGVERVDLLVAGVPCQPFSTMGQQKGVDDERWLWPAVARAVCTLEPSFLLLENVPALKANREAFGRILGDLHRFRFDAEWSLVSACSVGAPHLRQRLFVVAYARSERRQQEPGGAPGDEGQDEADAPKEDHQPLGVAAVEGRAGQWAGSPPRPYLADGLAPGLVRTINRGLGNAVVPRVAEVVARRMLPCPS